MINSAKMLLKLKNYDFDKILPQIQQWTDCLDDISPNDLQIYYYQTLQPIPQSDKFFVIDKIQKCKLMNSMIYCLIDWKYFAPSKPDKKTNWFEIKQVDQSIVQKYLEDKDNRQELKELLAQTSNQYKNSIQWIVQIVYNQQQEQQQIQYNNEIYEQKLQQLSQQIDYLKDRIDNVLTDNKNKDEIIQKLQNKCQKQEQQQEQILDSLKIVQINQKQYQQDVINVIKQIKDILENEEEIQLNQQQQQDNENNEQK